MKTYLTYGFSMALCGALLGMALFFLGFHDDTAKMESARWISMVLGIIISVGCIYLGMKEKRALTPADKPWGYGSAFVAGFVITLIGSVLGAVYNYAYFAIINPEFTDLVLQLQLDKMEAGGATAAQIEQTEPLMSKMINPISMTISGLLIGMVFNTVFSLIIAAFVKNRPEQNDLPQAV